MRNFRTPKVLSKSPQYRTPAMFRNWKTKHTEAKKAGKGKKK